MDIKTIEQELKTGQVAPQRLAEMSDWLAGTSSSLMDEELELYKRFADFYEVTRPSVKSDRAVDKMWQTVPGGIRQLELEITQKKIKVLLQTVGRHLKVAHDQAYNRY